MYPFTAGRAPLPFESLARRMAPARWAAQVTPDLVASELGAASALAVGLSVAHQALKVTPLAVSSASAPSLLSCSLPSLHGV